MLEEKDKLEIKRSFTEITELLKMVVQSSKQIILWNQSIKNC